MPAHGRSCSSKWLHCYGCMLMSPFMYLLLSAELFACSRFILLTVYLDMHGINTLLCISTCQCKFTLNHSPTTSRVNLTYQQMQKYKHRLCYTVECLMCEGTIEDFADVHTKPQKISIYKNCMIDQLYLTHFYNVFSILKLYILKDKLPYYIMLTMQKVINYIKIVYNLHHMQPN